MKTMSEQPTMILQESTRTNLKPRLLPKGKHPGFSKLKSQAGVYRCRLFPDLKKRNPDHSDYRGILQLTGSKAVINLWVQADGSLGLRLEKITERKSAAAA